MEKDNNKKKKVIIIVISIIIILVLALAISYAYFSTQLSGSDQIVKVGTLDLVLDETSEGITLDNAVGISDSEGLSLDGSTFELRNNGNKAVDYIIYLDDNTIGDNDTRIDDKYLKYNLNKNGADSGATLLTRIGANPNRVLDSGTIEGGGTNKYSLKLWITDEVDGNYSGQVFSGKLRVEVSQEREKEVATVLLDSIPKKNQYDDGIDTFITGTDPNNYIWYSGKLWRAVSVNNDAKTVKLVTQWNISTIVYNARGHETFEKSYMEEWLNDTTVDGFLGNLRDYENFIVTDAEWDASLDTTSLGSVTRPNGNTIVTDVVGLLNMYEYQSSNNGRTNGYLNNGLNWWTLTPYSYYQVQYINSNGTASVNDSSNSSGVRPSINLQSSVKIVDGDGTVDNPYRLEGDNDTNLLGTLLNTRYSGEYIKFGNAENNLYRIVSHETEGLTKITSAEPLKSSGEFIESIFGNDTTFSSTNIVGTFLNGEYLINYVDSEYSEMIEDSSTWYIGIVGSPDSYRLAKYVDTSMSDYNTSTEAKVGLLRYGELMSGQFERYNNNEYYWTLTPSDTSYIWFVYYNGYATRNSSDYTYGIKPALNLKSNVIITSGDGTKQNPFQIELAS
ncbi:MAG TPA: hypothetical protein IAB38_07325 [Candidatus Onthousia excrementipullorum]|uniref:DUF6273 domain-containing protein n=1 Tax=Candidatus Onthousia excrementipullorum TaxID=2840884 RepID=A0A9D1J465_9FIRM|nr:hypothetical protein [Candidatus Onthousia excrementipullorum]